MAGRRDQFRDGELATPQMAAKSLNRTLMDIYFRLEALERRRTADSLIVSSSTTTPSTTNPYIHVEAFTTGATVEGSFPRTFSCSAQPTAVKVGKAVNVTDGTALFYEAVAIDWSWAAGVFSIRYLSGLDVTTSYQVTLEIAHA